MPKKGPTAKKKWQRMERTQLAPVHPDALFHWREMHGDKPIPEANEAWVNDRYLCTVWYLDPPEEFFQNEVPGGRKGLVELSIHNHRRTPIRDWRHMQQIKNDVMGEEREGCELYPSEDRLLDEANEYHIFVLPQDGYFPFGSFERSVRDATPRMGKAKQRLRDRAPLQAVAQPPTAAK